MIVGQGQLDEVLHAGPEARRALIEEAAGVLKHRRRKEKALRKLEAMQANLTRLVDLTGELRRRLGPLGRQAAIARRAADHPGGPARRPAAAARRRLRHRRRRPGARADRRGRRAGPPRPSWSRPLAQARQRESELDADEQEHAPRLARRRRPGSHSPLSPNACAAWPAWPRSGTPTWWPSRSRRAPAATRTNSNAEAAALREQEAVLGERLEAARAQLRAATGSARAAEAALAEAERRLAARPARPPPGPSGWPGCAARSERPAAGWPPPGGGRPAGGRPRAGQVPRARLAQQEYEELQEHAPAGTTTGPGWPPRTNRRPPRWARSPPGSPSPRAAERRASAERAALVARRVRRWRRACTPSSTARTPRRPCWRTRCRPGDVLGAVAGLLTVADGAQEAIDGRARRRGRRGGRGRPRRRGGDPAAAQGRGRRKRRAGHRRR